MMSNIILKSLETENFVSFADRIKFTCLIDETKKEYMENTFRIGTDVFNKVSYVYGANGSGKTYFCKILREIQRLIAWSPISSLNDKKVMSMPQFEEMGKPVVNFAFDTSYKERPTFFAIEVVVDEITYRYEFSVVGKKIVSEFLSKKFRRTEKLLERTSPSFQDISLRSDLKPFETNKYVVKEEALCLPMAALLNNETANVVIDAIRSISVLNMTAPRLSPHEAEKSFAEERIEKYKKILRKADPTLRDMKVSCQEEETARQKIESDDFENREIIETKTTVGVETEHAVFENDIEKSTIRIDFFKDESLGTVKLFTALPHLFDVLENGGVLILDEIENGLHPALVKEMLELFMNKESNPRNAQLICTTHQPLLVNEKVRRDQVWITNKNEYGKSRLLRLSQLSTPRAKFNLSNKIIEGAMGCNPEKFFEEI